MGNRITYKVLTQFSDRTEMSSILLMVSGFNSLQDSIHTANYKITQLLLEKHSMNGYKSIQIAQRIDLSAFHLLNNKRWKGKMAL